MNFIKNKLIDNYFKLSGGALFAAIFSEKVSGARFLLLNNLS